MFETYLPPPEITTSLESLHLGYLYPYMMHWKTPLLVAILYIITILKINPAKPHSTPTKRSLHPRFKQLVVLHNLLLAGFSLWCTLSMLQGVIGNLWTHGWFDGICDIKFTLWNPTLFRVSYYFYLSKYYEFIDTAIILYKGRRASTLQIYHHAGAVVTMWAGCYYLAVPIAFFVIINAAIHSWMYVFYTLTAMGQRPRGKQWLTTCQIIQFIAGMGICVFYLVCPGCQGDRQKLAIYINLAYLFPLLGLFVGFFVKTYLKK